MNTKKSISIELLFIELLFEIPSFNREKQSHSEQFAAYHNPTASAGLDFFVFRDIIKMFTVTVLGRAGDELTENFISGVLIKKRQNPDKRARLAQRKSTSLTRRGS